MEGEDYETSLGRLTRAELLEMTLGMVSQLNGQQLQSFRSSLNGYLAKKTETETAAEATKKKHKEKEDHPFEMAKYRQRHIALHLQYDGAKYLGFAWSDDGETVESHLFSALTKLRLIESRETSGYSRCGRTDKGVSALGQVVALRLRSAIPPNSLVKDDETVIEEAPGASPLLSLHPEDQIMCRVKVTGRANKKKKGAGLEQCGAESAELEFENKELAELDYCQMINRCLPNEIRVIGWTEVTPEFSARFSATSRTYRYFFLRKDLDLSLMNEAAALLVGDHDFRNLCKMDMAHVSNFRRVIYEAKVSVVSGLVDETICMLEIRGIAFLWHMVRCIMAVLLMVGDRKESPDIITRLLDIDKNPSKPEYAMAPDLPLVLHDSGFEKLTFKYQPAVLWSLTAHYRSLWEEHTLAAMRVKNTLNFLSSLSVRAVDVASFESLILGRTLRGRSGEELPASRKRLRETDIQEEPSCMESEAVVIWESVLNEFQRRLSLRPVVSQVKGQKSALCLEAEHVPLLQRKMGEAYEIKKANLKGAKRDRLLKHEESKKAGAVNNSGEFFSRMRTQGSV